MNLRQIGGRIAFLALANVGRSLARRPVVDALLSGKCLSLHHRSKRNSKMMPKCLSPVILGSILSHCTVSHDISPHHRTLSSLLQLLHFGASRSHRGYVGRCLFEKPVSGVGPSFRHARHCSEA
ncbi:unnamed protein product [Symbiodinium sp. CCMP2592]|nr:unnamed protein product [Symbiodinium sp. CCMP2592]